MSEKAARLQTVIKEARELLALGENRTDEQNKELELKSAESQRLRKELEQEKAIDDVEEWSKSSAGMLPVAEPGKPVVQQIDEDGHVVIDTAGSDAKATRFKVEDEKPLMDMKTYKVISSSDYKSAFDEYIRIGKESMSGAALKVLQEGIDTAGGFLVPEEVLAAIIQKQPTPTAVAGRVRHLQTMRDVLVIPRVNYTTDDLYTTGIRATWTGEVPASSTAMRVTEPVFGQTRAQVWTAMMSMPITNDMIEDAAFPLMAWASGKFAETIELLRDNMALNGSGVGQPAGILVNPGVTGQPAVVVSGSASSLTADSLESVAMSLPPQYDTNACYVFNKLSTAKTIAQMKDGQGRYLWGAGMQDSGMVPGWKDRKLWGYDAVYSEFMPNIGASTYPVIFGDLSGYYMVERVGFSIQVLREVYAETNQILLLGRIRFGGQVAEDWKLKILQCHS